MAINIYSGGASAKSPKTPRVSSAAERASATTGAISGPAAASDSGSTAVKSTGILGKIGSFVGKAANVLGNILPGPAGAIAKAVGEMTSSNDPEWWQHVPGDGLTVNSPLLPVSEGETPISAGYSCPMLNERPTFLEFESRDSVTGMVMVISDRMATQYLMPAVRKVANAIVPQSASDYSQVFAAQATAYALWRCLKKFDYFIKHGYTFVPNVNDPAFPVFQVANAAWLQSTITRLEEYLHSHVRLPHTLCEYLTWRYGKVFRTNNSAKAAFVFYDILDLTKSTADYDNLISTIQSLISSTTALQTAASDLYNAYLDHDQEVLVSDETMMAYDSKEFCLRTNLDLQAVATAGSPWLSVDKSPIIIDSNLDNATVFMASTVSTTHDNTGTQLPLFPVYVARAYMGAQDFSHQFEQFYLPYDSSGTEFQAGTGWVPVTGSTAWLHIEINAGLIGGATAYNTGYTTGATFLNYLHMTVAAKALDFYNVGIFCIAKVNNSPNNAALRFIDLTSISMDMGSVPDLVIQNEQVLAFANLVSEENKHADTYRQVEKRVAKDVANFVENNEVAAIAK